MVTQGRRYYNRAKRIKKKRRIRFNSGNYYGLTLLAVPNKDISEIGKTDRFIFTLGPTWGMQRAYGRFYFNFHFSPSLFFETKESTKFYPLMGIRLGFNLSKERK